jgi:hypothetical protein
MHVLYIELSMRLLFREVAPAQFEMGVLHFGIRAKVLMLSLDGLVEWSLDQGRRRNCVWRTHFEPLNAPECQGVT